jgi:hypothetical protein
MLNAGKEAIVMRAYFVTPKLFGAVRRLSVVKAGSREGAGPGTFAGGSAALEKLVARQ